MALWVIVRGGGDLASGVVLRLHRAGLRTVVTELPQPLVVRRKVAFAEAVFQGECRVEEVPAQRVETLAQVLSVTQQGAIPVLVDPEAHIVQRLREYFGGNTPLVLVDGRMRKQPPENSFHGIDLLIGLGPGFVGGENCDAAIETHRGHLLGRVIWQGAPLADTGVPDRVGDKTIERVLRAPVDGPLNALAQIGDRLEEGQPVARIADQVVCAPFKGVLRGLMYPGLFVQRGMKIGDVDPRDEPAFCFLVSDKSLAVGGGVLEAILSRAELRKQLWD